MLNNFLFSSSSLFILLPASHWGIVGKYFVIRFNKFPHNAFRWVEGAKTETYEGNGISRAD